MQVGGYELAIIHNDPLITWLVKRRNKWICALKGCLTELGVFGPSGNPNSPPKVNRQTDVPWEIIEREDQAAKEKNAQKLLEEEERKKAGQDWRLEDKNAVLSTFFRGWTFPLEFFTIVSWVVDSADEVFGDTAAVSNRSIFQVFPSVLNLVESGSNDES